MEPAEYDGVFQNVITNQGGGPGEWYFAAVLLLQVCLNLSLRLLRQMNYMV
jgi:hypothetical protein